MGSRMLIVEAAGENFPALLIIVLIVQVHKVDLLILG